MLIQIVGVGTFSEIMQCARRQLELCPDPDGPTTVHTVLQALDQLYNGRFGQELYLEDGSPNQWNRVMLNGRDIRFLPADRLLVQDGDNVLISSTLAGG